LKFELSGILNYPKLSNLVEPNWQPGWDHRGTRDTCAPLWTLAPHQIWIMKITDVMILPLCGPLSLGYIVIINIWSSRRWG